MTTHSIIISSSITDQRKYARWKSDFKKLANSVNKEGDRKAFWFCVNEYRKGTYNLVSLKADDGRSW